MLSLSECIIIGAVAIVFVLGVTCMIISSNMEDDDDDRY